MMPYGQDATPEQVDAVRMAAEVEEARSYIQTFRTYTIPGTDFVKTNLRTIQLDDMTDDDALFVAHEFRRMEAAAYRRSQRRRHRPPRQ